MRVKRCPTTLPLVSLSIKCWAIPASIEIQPMPMQPMPKLMASANIKNPQTNLTRNEEALLSPEEKVIASRTT